MLTQSEMLIKVFDSIIKYEICWHCGFVLKPENISTILQRGLCRDYVRTHEICDICWNLLLDCIKKLLIFINGMAYKPIC